MKHRRTLARLGQRLSIVLVIAAAVVGTAAWTEPAMAADTAMPADAESLVLIRPLTGPEAEDLQLTVEGAVAENFSAVSASKDEEAQLEKGAAELVRMSREKKYRAYVTGMVKAGSRGRLLVLVVYSGKDGKPVGEAKFPGPTTKVINAKVDKQAGNVLAKLLRKTAVAGGAGGDGAEDGKEVVKLEVDLEEEPEAPAEEDEEEAESGEPRSPLDVNLAVGFMNMSLTYNQPVTDSFGFQLLERPTTPLTVRAGGNVYPGALFATDALADVGLAVRYYQSVGGSIAVLGKPFDISFSELDIGLRGRIHLGDSELGIGLGWGKTQTVMADDNVTFTNNSTVKDPGLFPDAVYTYLRAAVDGRYALTQQLSLTGGLGLRLPSVGTKDGQLGERRWFPRATASGMDAEIGAMYEVVPNLSVTADVDMRVYGLTMHSTSGDVGAPGSPGVSSVAGGATDRYLGGFAGVAYRL
jgi:hypothetical protein